MRSALTWLGCAKSVCDESRTATTKDEVTLLSIEEKYDQCWRRTNANVTVMKLPLVE